MEHGARRLRWEAFYDRSRPARHMLLVRLLCDGPPRPWPNPDRVPERIEWAWDRYREQVERTEWLSDDAVPFLEVYTGTEVMAEAFGCRVHRPDDDMPFALPLVDSAAGADRLRVPDLDAPCLRRLFEMADALWERAGPTAVMRLVDMQSPMDTAALIWEKRSFYTALIEEPEAVRELAAKVKSLLTTFIDQWFGRYGSQFVAHYPDYYMPGGITVSEDEIGAVSPAVFEALFLPELAQLGERYGGIGVHCCANARHQWDGLSRITGLRLLNLVQQPPSLDDAYRRFAPVTAQWHNWCGDDAIAYADALPGDARVVVEVHAQTRAEAVAAVERFRATRRGALTS